MGRDGLLASKASSSSGHRQIQRMGGIPECGEPSRSLVPYVLRCSRGPQEKHCPIAVNASCTTSASVSCCAQN
jgi:hypothetical protein